MALHLIFEIVKRCGILNKVLWSKDDDVIAGRGFTMKKQLGVFRCYSQHFFLLSREISTFPGRSNGKSNYCSSANWCRKSYSTNYVILTNSQRDTSNHAWIHKSNLDSVVITLQLYIPSNKAMKHVVVK